jgi:hypothetical protein
VHATSEEKSDDSKDCFYEQIEEVFNHFPNYHMKILLRDLSVKLGREDIFKPTIGNEILHQVNSDTGVRIVNSATSIIWLLVAQYSCTETFMNTPGPLLRGRLTPRLITY